MHKEQKKCVNTAIVKSFCNFMDFNLIKEMKWKDQEFNY